MDLPGKNFNKIAFIRRPKMEENMVIVMVKSIHQEHVAKPLQTSDKQSKIAVTFFDGI